MFSEHALLCDDPQRQRPGQLRRTLFDLALIGLARGPATLWVWHNGFRAVSDDDYARTVIAQQFAAAPHWDPSGSTWLPFPFWLSGLAMRLFGPHLWVLQVLAIPCSLASALAVYLAGQWLKLERPVALLAALGAALLPHAVWLGAAVIPDGYCAALAVLGLASSTTQQLRLRVIGGGLLSTAALCRYEVWSVCAFVAALTLFDAIRQRRASLLIAAGLSLAGPLAWMLYGKLHYGEPTFFISRVASYRHMLGRSAKSLAEGLFAYPRALVCAEPELSVGIGLALPLMFDWRLPANLKRPLLGAGCLLGFLVWGNLQDGAPTHHPERPLLCVWLVGTLTAASALLHWRRRLGSKLLLLLPCVLTLTVLRSWFTRRDDFAEREQELALGRRALALLPHSPDSDAERQELLIDTGDYGYFAVITGFEQPARAFGLVDQDPRQPKLDFASDDARLRHYLRAHDSRWLVVRKSALPTLGAVGPTLAETQSLALLKVDASYLNSP